MDRKNRVSRVTSMFLSLLLVLNCFGMTGLAFAVPDTGAGQERTVSDSQDQGSGGASEEGQGAAKADAAKAAAANADAADAGTAKADTGNAAVNQGQQESSDIGMKPEAESGVSTKVTASPEHGALSEAASSSESGEASSGDDSAEEGAQLMATRAVTSTNLADFLTDVIIDAPTDENGNYVINPNSTYEMTLTFSESEELQFDDEGTLVYDFPEGALVSDFGSTTFSIDVTDENGAATVHDNTFEVVNGQLRVHLNQNDPNFERLKAMPNVSFDLSISSRFDQNVGEILFNATVIKDFVFEEKSDLTIDKSVVYDMDTDTASYVLKVTSEGPNENVVIEDHLTGTALVFNQDVTVESSVSGALSVTPDYTAVENGFRVTIPQTVNGEVLTLRYTAAVDNTKISSNGTVEQTNNTARVTSDQVPDGKEASADFAGQVTFDRIDKTAAEPPVDLGDGRYEQTWTITVNADHKMLVGGTYISDWIAQNSRPFMLFTGDGIDMTVTMEDGTTETRTVSWDELQLYTNNNGTYGWGYLTPESDGKASYVITCKTLIDTEGALGSLTLINGAQVLNSYDEGGVTIEGIGEGEFGIKKEAVGTTSTETEWKVTVTVPGSGLPEMHVSDDAPKLTYEGQDYIDYFIEDSFEVEGLLDGESWGLYISSSTQRSYTMTFYRSGTQTDANKGVLPTPDGQPRDIVIHFKTAVNQDWLDLAAEDGYASSTLYLHRNYAAAWSGSYRTPTVNDYAIPIKPNLVKNFVERSEAEIDGVTYPVFRYSLSLNGPVEDGIVIHDAFNTEYLKFLEADGVKILGGTSAPPTVEGGTASAADTADGMDITVSSFPKQGDGSFYPYYEVSYALIVKDQAALEALNATAAASQGGVDLENTATWDELSSNRVVNYTYFPYVDKELLTHPTADNGYVAEFKVIINKHAEDLDPASDTLTIQDELSSNLRFIPDSLTITPANDSITVHHDDATNTLTFEEVPDETTFEVTYQARVLGSGNVTYSNTIKFGNFEKTVEEDTVVESSGAGSGSNPSITLVKRDSENISTTLAGATFQLFYMQDGNQVAVQDSNGQDVTFTTGADGRVLIVGNLQNLGWTLWADRTYCLVETAAPAGYELNTEPTYFILTGAPSSQMEFGITGDQLSVQDDAIKISVPVTKNWVGPIGADTVTVHLLADGTDTGRTMTLSADEGWTGSFEGLLKYDGADGHEIAYDVTEDPVTGYGSGRSGSVAEGFTFTNTNTETIEIPVTKTWVGPAADAVIVRLTADDTEVASAELFEANGWQGAFDDLPRYDPGDGHEIAYDVREDALTGYSTETAGSVAEGFTFTNTSTEEVAVAGSKTWDDADDQDGLRPESITVRLSADGAEKDSATVTEADGWAWSFANLPKYDPSDGHEVVYGITEDPVEGYTTSYESFDATNTHVPEKTSLAVSKTWADQDDKDGMRPESVTFHLLADGVDTGQTLTLTASDGWAGAFTDLAAFKAGQRVSYTVSEDSVDGYTTTVTGDAENGFTVTNSHEPKDMPPGPGKTTKTTKATKSAGKTTASKSFMPKTGDSIWACTVALAALVAGTLMLVRYASARRGRGRDV